MTAKEFNGYLGKIKYDKESLEKLYDFYYPRIIFRLKFKYKDADAEDIAQEFFLNLMACDGFGYVNSPTSWVYACCENLVRKKYGKSKESPCDFTLMESVTDDRSPEGIFENVEAKRVLENIDDEVTKKIIVMYYWEGYNLREISEILGIKQSTVKQKHNRTIKKLKKFLCGVSEKRIKSSY